MEMTDNKRVALSTREERITSTMQALGDSTRYKIFKLMQSGQEMCVSEIAEAIGVSVPAVSQHFRIFELVGLIDKARYGQKICYQLKDKDDFVEMFKNIN
jgi:DNA-binding transcriptional ArsR family regulator